MGKMREIAGVNQDTPGQEKKWFTDDDYWDLYVWKDPSGEITGIQLCYSKNSFERSLTWIKGVKYTHMGVTGDYGDYDEDSRLASPILVPDGIFDKAHILKRFTQDGDRIDKEIFDFVADKIRSYRPDLEFDNDK
jgi:hypothetical protein